MLDSVISEQLARIEEKAIRRVRTPEGARTYGQPIGTVITRDMIERAKRKRAREKAKAKGKTGGDKKPNDSVSNLMDIARTSMDRTDADIAKVRRGDDTRLDEATNKPIPSDYSEPGLPGMSKFKSKAESNRKRHEKLLGKMSQGSEVIDEKNGRTFSKVSASQYNLDNLYWESSDPNDEKDYSDADLADILKGVAEFSYTHVNDEGETVKDYTAKPQPDIMGGRATGNLGVGKKSPKSDTKPEPKKVDTALDKGEFDSLLDTYKEYPEGATASEKRSWDTSYRLLEGLIKKYNLVTDPEQKELGKKAIDARRRNLESQRKIVAQRVEYDKSKGLSTVSAKDLKVGDKLKVAGREEPLEVRKVSKLTNGYISVKTDVGTYHYAPNEEVSRSVGEAPATKKPEIDRSKVESADGYTKGELISAVKMKKGDKVFRKVFDDDANELVEVVLTVESTSKTRDGSGKFTYGVKFTDGSSTGGTPSVTRSYRAIPNEEKPKPEVEAPKASSGSESQWDDFDFTAPSMATPVEKEAWDNVVGNFKYTRELVEKGRKEGNDVDAFVDVAMKGFIAQLTQMRKDIEARAKERAEIKKPKTAVPSPTKYAEGNAVNIEPRPLVGDEVSKRAEEYEELVAKRVEQWRDYNKRFLENTSRTFVSTELIGKLEAFPGDKIPKSEDDLNWVQSPYNKDHQNAQWGGVTLTRLDDGKIQLNYGSKSFATDYKTGGVLTFDVKKNKYYLPEEGFKALAKDKNVKKFLNEKPPTRVKREDVPFWDYWNGIRGIDWMDEGEDDSTYNTPEKRKNVAKSESSRLGVNIGDDVNPEMHEVLNSVVETYRERYPVLLDNVIDTFAIDDDPRANAWVGGARWMRGVPTTKKPLVMGLGKHGYGNSSDAIDAEWKSQNYSWQFDGYKVGGDRIELAEKLGVTPDHLSAMYTFNHEMGHVVGHMIMGQTDMQGDSFSFGLPSRNPERSKKIAERYGERVVPILRKFGVLVGKSDKLSDYIDVTSPDDDKMVASKRSLNRRFGDNEKIVTGTRDKKLLGQVSVFNRTKLTGNLSGYGATNWHEIMAETWASYSMDENPTEFALELGTAMEELLLELSEEHGYIPAPDAEEKGLSLREAIEMKISSIFMAHDAR